MGAAHEGGKLGVEARCGLEERRVADALVDRELGAGGSWVRAVPPRRYCSLQPAPTAARS